MRIQLFTIYASAVGIWHAAAQDSRPHQMPSAACMEFNQRIVDKLASGQLAEAEAALSEPGTRNESALCIWMTLHNRANMIALSGRLIEAEVLGEQSLRILDKLVSPNDPIRFRPLQLLWSVQMLQGKLGKARQTFQSMRTLRLDMPQDRAMFYGASASQLHGEGRYKEAEQEYFQALAACKEAGRGESAEMATLLVGLGTMQSVQERYSDAVKTLDRAFAIVNSAKDTIPMDLVNILSVRAVLHARLGRWQSAEEDLKSAISIADRDTRLDTDSLKRLLVNYAYVLRKIRRSKEARSIEARAEALQTPGWKNSIVDVSELVDKKK